MRSKYGRLAVVVAATFAVVTGTAFGAGGMSKAAASRSPVMAHQANVSPAFAARVLNELSRQNARTSPKAMTHIHFILNWLPNVEFAGLWVAEKYGWWKKAGIQMSYTPWSVSVHPETDVASRGGNTFGFQAGAAIAIAASQHVPIVSLYTDVQKPVLGLTVLASSNIHTIKDLKGKKIGYQPHELYVPQTMLSYAGLSSSDWKPVPVSFDIVQLTAKRVDAYETFLTNEPIALQLQGVKTRSFAAADYGYHFYDDVLFTYKGLTRSNPALVRTVVGTVARGFKYAHTHVDSVARLTVKYFFQKPGTGESAQIHLKQQIMELRAFDRFSRDSSNQFSGKMTAGYWRDSVNTLYRYHLIKSKPAASSLFTNQFNPFR